jgi:DNA-binding LytR/AlgR family response regulator
MGIMNILIVEDEVPNQRLLIGMLANIRPQWRIMKVTDSVNETVEFLKAEKPQLIFMDIQLIDGVCFSIFDLIKTECPVIFTTAYDHYAIRAFKVNSIDYLLKPLKQSELLCAIEKFEKMDKGFSMLLEEVDYQSIIHAIMHGEKKYRSRFLIKGSTDYYKLDVANIAYFYSENKITFAVTFIKKEHIVDLTLDALEEELDPNHFFRANRKTIVHINSVYRFENYHGGKLFVKLNQPLNKSLIISRLKNVSFKEWIGR